MAVHTVHEMDKPKQIGCVRPGLGGRKYQPSRPSIPPKEGNNQMTVEYVRKLISDRTVKKDPIKRCVLYARFSPRPDAATSDACDKQMYFCREYAKKHGYMVMGEFEDRNKSRNDAGRPGILDAIAYMKRHWILVSYDESRFGASTAALVLEDKVHKIGGKLEFTTGAPGDDVNQRMLRRIMYEFDDQKRRMNNARTSSQMRKHVRNGRMMGGTTPYGFMVDPNDKKLMIECPHEKWVIAEIMRLRDVEGMTFRKLTAHLNDRGIEARGKKFWTESVYRTYKGARDGRYPKKTDS